VVFSAVLPYRLMSTLAPLVFLLGSLMEFGNPVRMPVFFFEAGQLARSPEVITSGGSEFIDEVCLNRALHLRYRTHPCSPDFSLIPLEHLLLKKVDNAPPSKIGV
jgi:hypothetical protein